MKNLILYALFFSVLLFSCRKNDEPTMDSKEFGQVMIKFDPIVNGKKLFLNDYLYNNGSKETFNISELKFFVSNIALINTQGNKVEVPTKDSYFLIDASIQQSLFPTFQIPEGEYTELIFNLGIDSITNTLPVEQRTGVLDVANGMYWSWNTGYIHFKMEGSSSQATSNDGKFRYHIGLYGGYNSPTVNNNRTIKVDLRNSGIAKVKKEVSSDIHLMFDLGKVFDGDTQISIAKYPTVMTSGPHQLIANNYAKMFIHDHTHNFQKKVTNAK